MDEILWSEQDGYTRRTNHLGGFEGGMTNGEANYRPWGYENQSQPFISPS